MKHKPKLDIVVEGFNVALRKVGKHKSYKVEAGCTISIEDRQVHAYKTCKNHTDNAMLKDFFDKFIDRIETILQSLDLRTLTEFKLNFNFIENSCWWGYACYTRQI